MFVLFGQFEVKKKINVGHRQFERIQLSNCYFIMFSDLSNLDRKKLE